jgi:hypothetical protein
MEAFPQATPIDLRSNFANLPEVHGQGITTYQSEIIWSADMVQPPHRDAFPGKKASVAAAIQW